LGEEELEIVVSGTHRKGNEDLKTGERNKRKGI